VVINSVYGCVFRMCLSGGFWRSVIFSRSVVVQSGFGMCVNWWSHVSSNGLIVVMSAYNIHWGGWCWFSCMYLVRYGYSIDAAIWFGCVVFRHAAKYFARCWYSGCSFIVHGIKYILFLLLCDGGCVLRMFGIGPGLVSMSPPRSIRSFMEWLFRWFGMLVVLDLLVRYFCLLVFLRDLMDL
jgi:hypothetical protein